MTCVDRPPPKGPRHEYRCLSLFRTIEHRHLEPGGLIVLPAWARR